MEVFAGFETYIITRSLNPNRLLSVNNRSGLVVFDRRLVLGGLLGEIVDSLFRCICRETTKHKLLELVFNMSV